MPIREGQSHASGVWRTKPKEVKDVGNRKPSTIVGTTYIALWESPKPVVFFITDTNIQNFVSAIPDEADLAGPDIDSTGLVPSGVLKTIKLMFDVQKQHQMSLVQQN